MKFGTGITFLIFVITVVQNVVPDVVPNEDVDQIMHTFSNGNDYEPDKFLNVTSLKMNHNQGIEDNQNKKKTKFDRGDVQKTVNSPDSKDVNSTIFSSIMKLVNELLNTKNVYVRHALSEVGAEVDKLHTISTTTPKIVDSEKNLEQLSTDTTLLNQPNTETHLEHPEDKKFGNVHFQRSEGETVIANVQHHENKKRKKTSRRRNKENQQNLEEKQADDHLKDQSTTQSSINENNAEHNHPEMESVKADKNFNDVKHQGAGTNLYKEAQNNQNVENQRHQEAKEFKEIGKEGKLEVQQPKKQKVEQDGLNIENSGANLKEENQMNKKQTVGRGQYEENIEDHSKMDQLKPNVQYPEMHDIEEVRANMENSETNIQKENQMNKKQTVGRGQYEKNIDENHSKMDQLKPNVQYPEKHDMEEVRANMENSETNTQNENQMKRKQTVGHGRYEKNHENVDQLQLKLNHPKSDVQYSKKHNMEQNISNVRNSEANLQEDQVNKKLAIGHDQYGEIQENEDQHTEKNVQYQEKHKMEQDRSNIGNFDENLPEENQVNKKQASGYSQVKENQENVDQNNPKMDDNYTQITENHKMEQDRINMGSSEANLHEEKKVNKKQEVGYSQIEENQEHQNQHNWKMYENNVHHLQTHRMEQDRSNMENSKKNSMDSVNKEQTVYNKENPENVDHSNMDYPENNLKNKNKLESIHRNNQSTEYPSNLEEHRSEIDNNFGGNVEEFKKMKNMRDQGTDDHVIKEINNHQNEANQHPSEMRNFGGNLNNNSQEKLHGTTHTQHNDLKEVVSPNVILSPPSNNTQSEENTDDDLFLIIQFFNAFFNSKDFSIRPNNNDSEQQNNESKQMNNDNMQETNPKYQTTGESLPEQQNNHSVSLHHSQESKFEHKMKKNHNENSPHNEKQIIKDSQTTTKTNENSQNSEDHNHPKFDNFRISLTAESTDDETNIAADTTNDADHNETRNTENVGLLNPKIPKNLIDIQSERIGPLNRKLDEIDPEAVYSGKMSSIMVNNLYGTKNVHVRQIKSSDAKGDGSIEYYYRKNIVDDDDHRILGPFYSDPDYNSAEQSQWIADSTMIMPVENPQEVKPEIQDTEESYNRKNKIHLIDHRIFNPGDHITTHSQSTVKPNNWTADPTINIDGKHHNFAENHVDIGSTGHKRLRDVHTTTNPHNDETEDSEKAAEEDNEQEEEEEEEEDKDNTPINEEDEENIPTLRRNDYDDDSDEVPDKKQFMVHHQLSDSADIFVYKSIEYIIVSSKIKFNQAKMVCEESYNGEIATVTDARLADFLAEALTETNLELDSLWIGGENKSINNEYNWYWTSGNLIDPKLFNSRAVINPQISDTKRMCLAFGTTGHLRSQFRPLDCNVRRSFICQRNESVRLNEGNSTHPSWITIDHLQYKIYYDAVNWEKASFQCSKHNSKATLAVISNYHVSQLLGRYLLIGRPSLDNAWIGARYDETMHSYKFDGEADNLANVSGLSQYPPWKSKKVEKTGGCVLLDRHLSNMTVFVEARCERLRSYICSIDNSGKNINFVDMIREDYGYRLHLHPHSWKEAYNFCKSYKYGGRLMEITDSMQLSHLLYLMGESRSDIRHVWLGGKYNGKEWIWAKTKSLIDTDLLNLIQNTSYSPDVEAINKCLNMDRENHIFGLHYGVDCSWRQPFVCLFSADDFEKLTKEEKTS